MQGRGPLSSATADREQDLLKDHKFTERASTSMAAKQAMLERFKSRPGPNDPALLARRAEREAVARAREERQAERERVRREEEARKEAERIAFEKAEVERKAREESERIERQLALEAAQKAARDARYAARKAAKRRK